MPRYGLLIATDRLLLMVRRRVAELWRTATTGADATLTDGARLYQELLGEPTALLSDPALASDAVREQLTALLEAHRARRPRSRAEIPERLRSICHANIDLERISAHWDASVHRVASVHSAHTSAVSVTARYGSAARGDPLYEALSQLGQLLRTVFLADYFVNEAFRRELLRVLDRGAAVNALKRDLQRSGRWLPSQTPGRDASCRRCVESAGQPRHGLIALCRGPASAHSYAAEGITRSMHCETQP